MKRPKYFDFMLSENDFVEAVDGNWYSRACAESHGHYDQPDHPWPDPPPLFRCDEVLAQTDVLNNGFQAHIVSDRLRAFFEAEAPGIAEYRPIRVIGSTGKAPLHQYWMMRWRSFFDCLDLEKSRVPTEDGGFLTFPVILGDRIPPDGLIGILKHYSVICLIRNDLRLKMIRSGIRKPYFPRVEVIWPEDQDSYPGHPFKRKPEGDASEATTEERDPKRDPAVPAPPSKPTAARRAAKPRAVKKHKPGGGDRGV